MHGRCIDSLRPRRAVECATVDSSSAFDNFENVLAGKDSRVASCHGQLESNVIVPEYSSRLKGK